jgi:hypothetical protein
MNTKKELTELTLDELYSEIRKLDDAFPSFKTKFHLASQLLVLTLIIVPSIYVLSNGFNFFIAAILLWTAYLYSKKFIRRNIIIKEIKSRSQKK